MGDDLGKLGKRWLVFEGGDGSGKSTQRDKAASYLRGLGYGVTNVREPGGTRVGEEIRKILLSQDMGDIDALTEFFLYTACRPQLTAEQILPALRKGDFVLSDRTDESTRAYQLFAGGLRDLVDEELFERIHQIAYGGLFPSLVLIYDISNEVAFERLGRFRGLDRIEQKGAEYHAKVRRGYLENAARNRDTHVVIDANPDADTVFKRTKAEIDKAIERAI